ncbi:MAG: hypothetical protein GY849_16825 [Deltaproteobacteria bacterium]|nr:hypothetical protein [Deltaproteobacteria bacterium]
MKFTRPAFRSIYRFSGGVPRLINIACDRMLLVAFGHNQYNITGNIAGKAIRELASRGAVRRYRLWTWKKIGLAGFLLCSALAIVLLYGSEILNMNAATRDSGHGRTQRPSIENEDIQTSAKTAFDHKPAKGRELNEGKAKPEDAALGKLGNYLSGMNRQYSRNEALKNAMELWDAKAAIDPSLDALENDQAFFRLASRQNGLLIRRIEGDFTDIKSLNLPAILAFHHPGGRFPVYLTLVKMDGKHMFLKRGLDVIEAVKGEVASYWSGVAYIPWRNFLDLKGAIPSGSTKDSITTLKILLRDIGFRDIQVNASYDKRTREAIRQIQKKHGIKVDGVVGSSTKIILYHEKKSFSVPHIAN